THHAHTNVLGRDPDADWGLWRTIDEVEHRPRHWLQVPALAFVIVPNTWAFIGAHMAGISDVYMGTRRVLRDDSLAAKVGAHRLAVSAWARYAAKEYVFWPALAGAFFPKVVLGNFLSSTVRDVWSGLTNLAAHTGDPVESWSSVRPPA